MKVSVVIPLYNKVRYIRRAVASVLAQTHQDFEVIVVDDGSTDGGGEVVCRMADPRVTVLAQENAGEGAARNRGVLEARCELAAFLDADDEWLPSFLETVMGLRQRHPEAGAYATAYRFSRGNDTWRPNFTECPDLPQGGVLRDYFHAALGPSPVWSSAVMIPKRVLDEVGGFPVGIKRGGDLHTWARIALRYPVAWSPVDGAVYHLSADGRACNVYLGARDVAAASVIEEFLQSGCEPVSSRRMVEEYLVSRRLMLALDYFISGKTDWALALLDKTRHTTMFKRRRLLLRCAFRIPPKALEVAVALKGRLGFRSRRTRQRITSSSLPEAAERR